MSLNVHNNGSIKTIMQNNKPVHPILAKAELHESVIPILLFTYKYGIAEIPSDIAILKKLNSLGWATINIARGQSLCMLTDAGASWVEEHFFQILQFPLYLTYPALVAGDEIQLLEDINSDNRLSYRLTGPTMSMDRGRYFLYMVNNNMVTVTDDCDVPYKMNIHNTRDILVFRPSQLTTLEAELKKRFHPIRIKSLTKRLHTNIPTLTLTEWVEELYNRKHTKWRIGGSNTNDREE